MATSPSSKKGRYHADQLTLLSAVLPVKVSTANQGGTAIISQMAVRRLTPTECERLQGFPDGYTAIPWKNKLAEQCPDGPRYRALCNSMAVPVIRWIGERIALIAALNRDQSGAG